MKTFKAGDKVIAGYKEYRGYSWSDKLYYYLGWINANHYCSEQKIYDTYEDQEITVIKCDAVNEWKEKIQPNITLQSIPI